MYPFKHVKGVAKTQCKCGAMLDNCANCKLRTRCPSCALCLECGQRVRETWKLDLERPVRYDMRAGAKAKGNDLQIARYPIVMTPPEIIGKGSRHARNKGLLKKEDLNV